MFERIQAYVSNRAQENQGLDFKRDRYEPSDRGTAEFLKDANALANASGGKIVLGVETDADGHANKAPGFECDDLDNEANRLLNILKDGMDPPLKSVRVETGRGADGSAFLEVTIFESPLGPHRIVKKGKYERAFFLRHGRTSPEASMNDIRHMFENQSRFVHVVRQFAADRRSAISRGEYLRPGVLPPLMVLHVTPMRTLGDRTLVRHILERKNHFAFAPTYGSVSRARPNVYGAINAHDDGKVLYVQSFHNNCVEIVLHDLVYGNDEPVFRGGTIAHFLSTDFPKYLQTIQAALSEDTYGVHVGFLGVSNRLAFKAPEGFEQWSGSAPPVPNFEIPDASVRFDDQGAVTGSDLKAISDLIWNCWGEDHCGLLDEQGKLKGR